MLKLKVWCKLFINENEYTVANDQYGRQLLLIVFAILSFVREFSSVVDMESLFSRKNDDYIPSPVAEGILWDDVFDVNDKTKNAVQKINSRYEEDLPESSDVFNHDRSVYTTNEYHELPFELVRLQDNYEDIMNFISIFNYFGQETYYTRGAFMHVVMSMQTCKNNKFTDIDASGYLDSFIENLADFILHHGKQKYAKRMLSALDKLQSNDVQLNELCSNVANSKEIVSMENNPNLYMKFILHAGKYFIVSIMREMSTLEALTGLTDAYKGIERSFKTISEFVQLRRTSF